MANKYYTAVLNHIPMSPHRKSAPVLAEETGNTERRNRMIINKLRADGEIICADDRGYFIPTTEAELTAHYRKLRGSALSMLKTLKAERKKLIAAGVDLAKIEGRKHG